jgi:hypothetical protein
MTQLTKFACRHELSKELSRLAPPKTGISYVVEFPVGQNTYL